MTNLQTPPWQQYIQSKCAAANNALTIFITSHSVGNIPAFNFLTRMEFINWPVWQKGLRSLIELRHNSFLLFELNFLDVLCMLMLKHELQTSWGLLKLLRYISVLFLSYASLFNHMLVQSQHLLYSAPGSSPGAGKYCFRGYTEVSSTDPWCTGLLFPS